MKLEAGKYYKTRDGHKTYIACVSSPFESTKEDYQAVGYVEGTAIACSWSPEGKYLTSEDSASDLVEEWREPVKFSVWANVYAADRVSTWSSKKEADNNANPFRLACIELKGEY